MMKNMEYGKFMAALAVGTMLVSSCAIRIDKKKVLEMVRFEREHTLDGSDVFSDKDTVLTEFTTLDAMTSMFDYELVQDDTYHVNVHVPENFLPYLDVTCEDGHLRVMLSRDDFARFRNCGGMKITVYAPSVDTVNISGICDFECGKFDIPRPLEFYVTGSSDVELGSLSAPEINFTVSGSGDVDVDGLKAGKMFISIAGSADMEIGRCDVSSIEATVAGSGDIELTGKAGKAVLSVAGSGSVDASALECGSVDAAVKGSGSIRYRDADGHVREK